MSIKKYPPVKVILRGAVEKVFKPTCQQRNQPLEQSQLNCQHPRLLEFKFRLWTVQSGSRPNPILLDSSTSLKNDSFFFLFKPFYVREGSRGVMRLSDTWKSMNWCEKMKSGSDQEGKTSWRSSHPLSLLFLFSSSFAPLSRRQNMAMSPHWTLHFSLSLSLCLSRPLSSRMCESVGEEALWRTDKALDGG